jgi:hypothetical protein
MRRTTLLLPILLAAAFGPYGGASAQPKSEWEIKMEERNWAEAEVKLPAYPNPENLIEFEASPANPFRFFVDSQSIVAGKDGAIRYTLVARSSSGNDNVSYNGLRCKTNAHKVYANGRADKTWATVRDSEWKELQFKTVSRQHVALMREFFCPAGVPIATAEEGVNALRRGVHPDAVSRHSNFTR